MMASPRTCSSRRRPAWGRAADAVARLGGLYLAVTADGRGRIARVRIETAQPPLRSAPASSAARAAARAIESWEADPGPLARLPRAPAPTPFQERLRAALVEIPAGEVRTYGELARALGTSPRAVGAGCRGNPLPLLVPCHRVVAVGGTGGFAGAREGPAASLKAWLLAREGALENPGARSQMTGCSAAPQAVRGPHACQRREPDP